MKKQDYNAVITAAISLPEAFNYISDLSTWWTENIEGATNKLGESFTIHFGETFVTFKTVEFVPNKEIAWLVTDCNLHWLKDTKEWNNTTLHIELTAGGNQTSVHFTHIGLTPEVECFDDCRKGWDGYFKDSLFQLLTTGKGAPQHKKLETAVAN